MMTNIQLQERAKRRRNQRRGLMQPPGTHVYAFAPTGKPWMKPGFSIPSCFDLGGFWGLMAGLLMIPKFWKRKKLGYEAAR